ncbi:hypothetical protein EC840_106172 [Rahnella sp. JUb53]|nr:hypothetical protein EC840_106172 [Rahnella sp. JUb53]
MENEGYFRKQPVSIEQTGCKSEEIFGFIQQ